MHKPVDRMAVDPEEFNVQAEGSDRCPPSFLQRLLGEQGYGSRTFSVRRWKRPCSRFLQEPPGPGRKRGTQMAYGSMGLLTELRRRQSDASFLAPANEGQFRTEFQTVELVANILSWGLT